MPVTLGEVRKAARVRYLMDLNHDHRASVLLSGSGRSGTTWVSDIINCRNEYRYIFEPLDPRRVPLFKDFGIRRYLRPDDRRKEFIEPVAAVLTGRARSPWMDAYNKRFISRKRLIKDIRAHHLLRWIHENFRGVPIILLLRHPCAVARSKLKMRWDVHLDEFLVQEELVSDFLAPFTKEIASARDEFEKHVFMWCVENYVPMRQFADGEIHLAFYEEFCSDPRHAVEKIFAFLGAKPDEQAFIDLERPSSQSTKASAIVAGTSLLESWRKDISESQVKRAVEILRLFGLDAVYREGPMPDIRGAARLSRSA